MQRLLQLAKDNSSLAIKKVKVIVTIFSIVQVCEKLVSLFIFILNTHNDWQSVDQSHDVYT